MIFYAPAASAAIMSAVYAANPSARPDDKPDCPMCAATKKLDEERRELKKMREEFESRARYSFTGSYHDDGFMRGMIIGGLLF